MLKTQTFTVSKAESGQRLDKFLLKEKASLSRSQIKRLVESGHVTVDNKNVKCSLTVREGQIVKVQEPPEREAVLAAEHIPIDVIYEDSSIIVVNKSAGMVVHPAPGHSGGTLVNALLARFDFKPIMGDLRPGIVHRLDKDTSGVMVVAKGEESLTKLGRQFKNRQVEKTYKAIVVGEFSGEVVSDKSIARSRRDRKRMAAGMCGREAHTDFKVLEKFQGLSFVEARPRTGRTHQVRVHLAGLGFPIVGDRLYLKSKMLSSIGDKGVKAKVALFPRQALHAYSLGFSHPQNGKRLAFKASLPEDMRGLIDFLRKPGGFVAKG